MLNLSLGSWSAVLVAATSAPQPLAIWVAAGSVVTASLGVLVFVKTQVTPWIAVTLKRRSIERHGGARLFTSDGIERAMRYYIAPLCQNVDPAGEEDLRALVPARQKLFESIRECLRRPGRRRYLMLLADSGMGKTSALLNFYVRHLRKWRKPYDLVVVPLGDRRADEVIAGIEDKRNTSLFLDALDEDAAAIRDLPTRMERIVELTRDFRSVLISCRTQFFSSEQETPRKVGVLRFDARPAGEAGEYVFYKLYLSPLDDRQVARYLRLRYPFWRPARRRAARKLVSQLSDLSARPMLLAHIEDILGSGEAASLGGVYDAIVRAWLQRESSFVEPKHLLEFSKRLAVDLVVQRDRRGGEKISRAELAELAEAWQVPLASWQLSGRSLLNRDVDGNYKFAHRSIMEFLFALRVADHDLACATVEWTDLIGQFALDFVDSYVHGRGGPLIDLAKLSETSLVRRLVTSLPLSGAAVVRVRRKESIPLLPVPFVEHYLPIIARLLSRYNETSAALLVVVSIDGKPPLPPVPPFSHGCGQNHLNYSVTVFSGSSLFFSGSLLPRDRLMRGIATLAWLLGQTAPPECAIVVAGNSSTAEATVELMMGSRGWSSWQGGR